MRKIVVASVVVIIVLATSGFGLWFILGQREALQVSFDGMSVKSIGLTSATLNIRLKIYNPNTIELVRNLNCARRY